MKKGHIPKCKNIEKYLMGGLKFLFGCLKQIRALDSFGGKTMGDDFFHVGVSISAFLIKIYEGGKPFSRVQKALSQYLIVKIYNDLIDF